MSDQCGVKRGWKRCCFSRAVRKELAEDALSAQWEEAMCVPRNRASHVGTASWDQVLLGIFNEQVKKLSQVMTRRIRGQMTNGLLDHGSYANQ